MHEAMKRLNDLADLMQDSKQAISTLYMVAAGIAHGEGTATDYSNALFLLYDVLSEKVSEQQTMLGEISNVIKQYEEA